MNENINADNDTEVEITVKLPENVHQILLLMGISEGKEIEEFVRDMLIRKVKEVSETAEKKPEMSQEEQLRELKNMGKEMPTLKAPGEVPSNDEIRRMLEL